MWVRTQDRERLVKCVSFEINGETPTIFGYTKSYGIALGKYSTEKKALKVLDSIQYRILCEGIVFQMPQDDEVF